MAIGFVERDQQVEVAIGTALSILVPGDDVHVMWFRPAVDAYFVYKADLEDGDAVAAFATTRMLVPAGEAWPLLVRPGYRIGVWAASGSDVANVTGEKGRR